MSSSFFPDYPDDANLWVYVADRPLDEAAAAALHRELDDFFANWTSHGRAVNGEARLIDGRFLLVAARLNEEGDLSGCGIDASVNALEDAAARIGVAWMPALAVAFRDDSGRVQVLPRPAFRRAVREGTVTAETPVFDTSLNTVGDLRARGLEQRAADAWHARVFRIPAMAS